MSPQGEWVDLDIDLAKPHHEDGWTWNSGFVVSSSHRLGSEDLVRSHALLFSALRRRPINLFRSQGPPPNRAAVVRQATMSDTFHNPEKFGLLRLIETTPK